MAIITVSGKIGCGKDLLCKRIQYNLYKKGCEELDFPNNVSWEDFSFFSSEKRNSFSGLYRRAYGDKLKLTACAILGIDYYDYDDRELKEDYYVNMYSFKLLHKSDLEKLDDYQIINNVDHIGMIYNGVMSHNLQKNMWANFRVLMLQYFGTNVCRTHIPHIWVNSLFSTYEKDENIIITDARFVNEIEKPNEFDNSILKIKIVRPETDFLVVNVESEVSLDTYDDFDYILVNDGTVDDFLNKIDTLFSDKIYSMFN